MTEDKNTIRLSLTATELEILAKGLNCLLSEAEKLTYLQEIELALLRDILGKIIDAPKHNSNTIPT